MGDWNEMRKAQMAIQNIANEARAKLYTKGSPE